MNQTALPLRDIHTPPDVSWWPLAPGWWILAGLVVTILIAAFLYWRWHKSRRVLRIAQIEIAAIEADFNLNRDSLAAVRTVSMLLRRIALSRYPRAEVASLVGDDWLRWLDRGLVDEPFFHGPGRSLKNAPYMPANPDGDIDVDVAALLQLCQRWLNTEFNRKSSGAASGVGR